MPRSKPARTGDGPRDRRRSRQALDNFAGRLATHSERHESLFARGYVVVRDAFGGVVTEAASVKPSAALELEFHDDKVGVVVAGSGGWSGSRRGGSPDCIADWASRACSTEIGRHATFRTRPDALRPVTLEPGVAKYAEGSCLARFGDTHVLCTATVEERVPPLLRDTGKRLGHGRIRMLPRSTQTRTDREAARGRQSGRTQEIQRLIGRSLRAVTDLGALGERQIRIDCDVLQADGGTRTAAITGSYVALYQACRESSRPGRSTLCRCSDSVAAISCGVGDCRRSRARPRLCRGFAEAMTDANFVLTGIGGIVEIQATGGGRRSTSRCSPKCYA